MARPLDQIVGRSSGPLFLPVCFDLARRMESISWSEAAEDPGLVVHALKQARTLLNADGFVGWFDTWLEAEAAGLAPGREACGADTLQPPPLRAPVDAASLLDSAPVRAALTIVRNLAAESAERPLLAAITGPHTLLTRLAGGDADAAARRAIDKDSSPDGSIARSAMDASLALARGYLDIGVSALILAEEEEAGSDLPLQAAGEILRLAAYFNTPVILLSRHPMPPVVADAARKLRIWTGGDADKGKLQLIPTAAFRAGTWEGARAAKGTKKALLSDWDLDGSVEFEQAIALSREIRG